jgi:putative membrane protein
MNFPGATADCIRGAILGVANIIPGVSGGTLALILGIYERFIRSIQSIGFKSIRYAFRALTFRPAAWKELKVHLDDIDFFFLMRIALGALAAIILLAKLMTWLLETHHDMTYGFFFGLVFMSFIPPFLTIRNRRRFSIYGVILLSALGVILLSMAVSPEDLIQRAEARELIRQEASGNAQPERTGMIMEKAKVFLSGSLAISAMILPGISGSFLLLLLGSYFDILEAIATRDLLTIGIFALGCLAGVILFSRLLHFLLERFHDITMSFLAGLVAGSLWLVWPFKATVTVGSETVYLYNIIPALETGTLFTLATMAAGALLVAVMIRFERRRTT